MEDNISIFNIGEHKDELNAGMFRERAVSNLFDPKLKDAKDHKVCIIRPMPYINNPVKSIVSKNFYVFKDAVGSVFFDSRTTFNRPAERAYEYCPVSDLWLKLRNSTDTNIQARSQQLRQQRANYAYVQIVKFPGEEALEGQIKVMRLPAELTNLFAKMAKPDENEVALGAIPVQPFDIINGKNIKCDISGKVINGTLMREWKFETVGNQCEASFPLGVGNAFTPVSKLKQEDVIAYFKEHQTIDMEQQYGYHEPVTEVKMRVKAILQSIVIDIPGLRDVVANYFPELHTAVQLDQNAQPAKAIQNIPTGNAMNVEQGPNAVIDATIQNADPIKSAINAANTIVTNDAVNNAETKNSELPNNGIVLP